MTATTIPAGGKCIECRKPVCLRAEYRRTRPEGVNVYASKGLCGTCDQRARYRANAAREGRELRAHRRPQVPRDVLLDEVPFLRASGESNERIAARLGMSMPAFERALYRNGIPVDRKRYAA